MGGRGGVEVNQQEEKEEEEKEGEQEEEGQSTRCYKYVGVVLDKLCFLSQVAAT